MESGVIKISQKELSRQSLLKLVCADTLSLNEASIAMGVSYRQAKRLKSAYVLSGVSGILHGNRGRSPSNKISQYIRSKVLELSTDKYASFNDNHFCEMLSLVEGIDISRESIRKIRRDAGIKAKCKRRVKKHHKRRDRKICEGLMLLWDGSTHKWFGNEHKQCCAMAAIDDATSRLVGLYLADAESSWAYFELLRRVISSYGIPASIYQDRHSIHKRNDPHWSIDEELSGKQEPTQLGYALESLGIEAIFAQTPQAKGRVERVFKTLQDRLCAMFKLKGITDIKSANDYIDSEFLEEFNAKYSQAPQDSVKAWRKLKTGVDINRILSFKYSANVGNDNTIRFGGMIIDIPPGPKDCSYAGSKVEMRQLLDGSWNVYHMDKLIAQAPYTNIGEPIRAMARRKDTQRPVYDSKWIYTASESNKYAIANTAKPTARRTGAGITIKATKIA
jgi:transposase